MIITRKVVKLNSIFKAKFPLFHVLIYPYGFVKNGKSTKLWPFIFYYIPKLIKKGWAFKTK